MALTVTLTDNQDATGLTATVAGSGGGAVSVYWRAYPEGGHAAWAGPAARTGDGAVSLAVGPGAWWVYAAAGGAASAPVAGYATAAVTPVATRVRAAVKAALAALPFAHYDGVGRPTATIYEQLAIDPDVCDLPCLAISTADGVAETVEPDTNATRLVGLPVVVAFLTSTSGPETLAAVEGWRELVRDRFNGPRPPGVPEAVRSAVEPLVVAAPGDPKLFSVRSALVVRVFCRVPQPNGA